MASSDVHLERHRQREQRADAHLGLARRESSARRAAVGSRTPSSCSPTAACPAAARPVVGPLTSQRTSSSSWQHRAQRGRSKGLWSLRGDAICAPSFEAFSCSALSAQPLAAAPTTAPTRRERGEVWHLRKLCFWPCVPVSEFKSESEHSPRKSEVRSYSQLFAALRWRSGVVRCCEQL